MLNARKAFLVFNNIIQNYNCDRCKTFFARLIYHPTGLSDPFLFYNSINPVNASFP